METITEDPRATETEKVDTAQGDLSVPTEEDPTDFNGTAEFKGKHPDTTTSPDSASLTPAFDARDPEAPVVPKDANVAVKTDDLAASITDLLQTATAARAERESADREASMSPPAGTDPALGVLAAAIGRGEAQDADARSEAS